MSKLTHCILMKGANGCPIFVSEEVAKGVIDGLTMTNKELSEEERYDISKKMAEVGITAIHTDHRPSNYYNAKELVFIDLTQVVAVYRSL